MAAPLVPDALWEIVAPLLPPEPPPDPRGGRPRVSNRRAFTGIVFVLRAGLAWGMLPAEMGCGSGVTCWRRFAAWTQAGVWQRLHQETLGRLGRAGQIVWWWSVVDAAALRAQKGGRTPAPAPWTGARPAANATCSPTRRARRWRC